MTASPANPPFATPAKMEHPLKETNSVYGLQKSAVLCHPIGVFWHRNANTPKVQRYSKFVLLVDDSPTDLFLFKRLLERAGFAVIATSEPGAAMSRIVSGDIGCLVTDHATQISGQELVSLVRAVRLDIGVIFLSGAEAPRELLPPDTAFINKNDKQRLVEIVTGCMSRFKAA